MIAGLLVFFYGKRRYTKSGAEMPHTFFLFLFSSFQAVMMCWWPSGSPLPLLANVLCHLSDHHCTTTAAASLSDCYGKAILHMDGNHCREILSCGLLKPMSFAPSSWWTDVIADNRIREGLFMFQVVLQPQLCPSTEILLSISLK